MGMDSLSQALQSRRGKGIDPSMINLAPPGNPSREISKEKPQDVRKGFEAGASATEPQGGVGIGETDTLHSGINSRLGMGEQTEGLPHPGPQHTSVVNEANGAPLPASQSPGEGLGELNSQIQGYVTGHASQSEYDQLSGMKPRSLGERAKMMALKEKYADGKK